jgi:Cu2+-containing amine oxidase
VNAFVRPVEGPYGVVDPDSGDVLEVIDAGIVPLSRDDHD